MESRVTLTTKTKFEVSKQEMRRFYITMALEQYSYKCEPEYSEAYLLRRLRNDFNRFNRAMIKVCDVADNDLTLYQMRCFAQHHYGALRRLVGEIEQERLDAKQGGE